MARTIVGSLLILLALTAAVHAQTDETFEEQERRLQAENAPTEAAVKANEGWIRKIKHVVNVWAGVDCPGGPQATCFQVIGVQVDYPKNLDDVERQLPSKIGGFPVVFNLLHDPNMKAL